MRVVAAERLAAEVAQAGARVAEARAVELHEARVASLLAADIAQASARAAEAHSRRGAACGASAGARVELGRRRG